MVTYETRFELNHPVIDIDAARAYLAYDNMTYYLLDQDFLCGHKNDILHIEWILQTANEGVIRLTTKTELEETLLRQISDWIRGQNSDGLGEGFEQQDFACYDLEVEQGWESEDDEYREPDYVCAGFDWEENDYELKKIC